MSLYQMIDKRANLIILAAKRKQAQHQNPQFYQEVVLLGKDGISDPFAEENHYFSEQFLKQILLTIFVLKDNK